jgi:hypothetical protein
MQDQLRHLHEALPEKIAKQKQSTENPAHNSDTSRQLNGDLDMKSQPIMLVVMLSVAICSVNVALSGSNEHTLIKSLGGSKVSLQQGLTAAQRHGQPISGKFEVEDGKFQLSVYIANKEKFSELLVDYNTGKIVKSEPITLNGDLDAAKAQSAILTKAKITLRAAIDKAIRGSSSFRAVSVTPAMKDGHAIASVVLIKGEELKSVEQSLE